MPPPASADSAPEASPPAPSRSAAEVEERDLADLTDAFCFDRALATTMPSHAPHAYFDPPSGTPHPPLDEWDLGHGITLASCEEISADVLETWTTKDTVASLIELEADVVNDQGDGPGNIATEQYLVIHAGPERIIHRLTSITPPMSEESPDVDCELSHGQLRDIGLGPQPEWIAVRTHEVGDCYECDFCWEQSATYRRLVICTHDAPRAGCIEVPLDEIHTYTPRSTDPEDEDEDCDDRLDADERLAKATHDLAQDLLEEDQEQRAPVARALGIDRALPPAEFSKAVASALDDLGHMTSGFAHAYTTSEYGVIRLEAVERDGMMPGSFADPLPVGDHSLERLFDEHTLGPDDGDRSLHDH